MPQGLPFRVALTQGIDTATSAAGDAIKGKLIAPIENRSTVLIPAGAIVTARIVGIRQFYRGMPYVSLDLKLETVDVGGVSVTLTAIPDTGQRFRKTKSGTLQRRVELGNVFSLDERSANFVFQDVRQPFLINIGLESMWVTALAAERGR